MGTKCLRLGTNRLGTKDPWVRNDWIPFGGTSGNREVDSLKETGIPCSTDRQFFCIFAEK